MENITQTETTDISEKTKATTQTFIYPSTTSREPSQALKTFAAASAMAEEEALAAKGKHPDRSTPVKAPKRVWRPRVKTQYEESKDLLDSSDDLDWLFKDHSHVLIQEKTTLSPRDDKVKFDAQSK